MPQSPLAKESSEADLRSAKRVLRLEAEGLRALADDLGRPFVAAVEVLEKVSGRVVVTGIGKSGHVARKIAAPWRRPASRRSSSIRRRRATAISA